MDNAVFTRYLYFLDEAKYSLLHSMIKKTSFDEVIFWTGEIYYSGFSDELWEMIWSYYYRYIAIKYSKYENKLIKKHNDYNKERDIKYLIESFNLLYYLKNIDYKVYFREKEYLNKLYSLNKSWLELFNKDDFQLLINFPE